MIAQTPAAGRALHAAGSVTRMSWPLHRSGRGAGGMHALRRKMAREGAALADRALHLELRSVPLQDVLDDGEPEPRAAGGARAALIDAVEALREPRDMLGRDADAGISD